MAKYFIDTEFIEDGKTIDLISIGIVDEGGREFYAQNFECDFDKASDWVKENVFPHLTGFDMTTLLPIIKKEEKGGYGDWYNRTAIASYLAYQSFAMVGFVALPTAPQQPDPAIEFWGYYSAYDHVALCQLFGTMMDLPQGWPMLTYDLRQMLDRKGFISVKQPDVMPHNALSDARWIRDTYKRYENE